MQPRMDQKVKIKSTFHHNANIFINTYLIEAIEVQVGPRSV